MWISSCYCGGWLQNLAPSMKLWGTLSKNISCVTQFCHHTSPTYWIDHIPIWILFPTSNHHFGRSHTTYFEIVCSNFPPSLLVEYLIYPLRSPDPGLAPAIERQAFLKKHPSLSSIYRKMGEWHWNGCFKDYETTRFQNFEHVLKDMVDHFQEDDERIISFEALNIIIRSTFDASTAENNIFMAKVFSQFMTRNPNASQDLQKSFDLVYKHITQRQESYEKVVYLDTLKWLQFVSLFLAHPKIRIGKATLINITAYWVDWHEPLHSQRFSNAKLLLGEYLWIWPRDTIDVIISNSDIQGVVGSQNTAGSFPRSKLR